MIDLCVAVRFFLGALPISWSGCTDFPRPLFGFTTSASFIVASSFPLRDILNFCSRPARGYRVSSFFSLFFTCAPCLLSLKPSPPLHRHSSFSSFSLIKRFFGWWSASWRTFESERPGLFPLLLPRRVMSFPFLFPLPHYYAITRCASPVRPSPSKVSFSQDITMVGNGNWDFPPFDVSPDNTADFFFFFPANPSEECAASTFPSLQIILTDPGLPRTKSLGVFFIGCRHRFFFCPEGACVGRSHHPNPTFVSDRLFPFLRKLGCYFFFFSGKRLPFLLVFSQLSLLLDVLHVPTLLSPRVIYFLKRGSLARLTVFSGGLSGGIFFLPPSDVV